MKYKIKDISKLERFYNSLVRKLEKFSEKSILTYEDAEKIHELDELINKLSQFFQPTQVKRTFK